MSAFEELAQAVLRLARRASDSLQGHEERIKDLELRHDRQGFLNDRIATYADADLLKRFEKMEKTLSEEMARTREMDDILAGVVKRVGYVGPASTPDQKTLDDIVANPGDYEVKTVTPLGWASRYFQSTNAEAITSKFAKAKFLPDGFQSSDYNFAFDASASPSGIPFSVALEFLKAGRKVALKGWVRAWIQAHPVYGISFHRGYDDVVQCFAVTEGALTAMMGSDWMVLPEKPQNP